MCTGYLSYLSTFQLSGLDNKNKNDSPNMVCVEIIMLLTFHSLTLQFSVHN